MQSVIRELIIICSRLGLILHITISDSLTLLTYYCDFLLEGLLHKRRSLSVGILYRVNLGYLISILGSLWSSNQQVKYLVEVPRQAQRNRYGKNFGKWIHIYSRVNIDYRCYRKSIYLKRWLFGTAGHDHGHWPWPWSWPKAGGLSKCSLNYYQ